MLIPPRNPAFSAASYAQEIQALGEQCASIVARPETPFDGMRVQKQLNPFNPIENPKSFPQEPPGALLEAPKAPLGLRSWAGAGPGRKAAQIVVPSHILLQHMPKPLHRRTFQGPMCEKLWSVQQKQALGNSLPGPAGPAGQLEVGA